MEVHSAPTQSLATTFQTTSALKNGYSLAATVVATSMATETEQHFVDTAPSDALDNDPPRRRVLRACDRCNAQRTKCDGEKPCSTCKKSRTSCEYRRTRRKRGRAPKKDHDALHIDDSPNKDSEDNYRSSSPQNSSAVQAAQELAQSNTAGAPIQQQLPPPPVASQPEGLDQSERMDMLPSLGQFTSNSLGVGPSPFSPSAAAWHGALMDFEQYDIPGDDRPQPRPGGGADAWNYGSPRFDGTNNSNGVQGHSQMAPTSGAIYAPEMPWPGASHRSGRSNESGRASNNARTATEYPFGRNPDGAPGPRSWSQASSTPLYENPPLNPPSNLQSYPSLRYPVLKPALPYIAPIMPISLACDLLELYWRSSTTDFLHPSPPYVQGYVFRKRSILHGWNPRPCNPALLVSMLWVAAQTSDSSFLNTSPSARPHVCAKLLSVMMKLLKPPSRVQISRNDVHSNNAYGVTQTPSDDHSYQERTQWLGVDPFEEVLTASVDDIAAYMNLATVVSASEHKGASIRWWSIAWSLARIHKLNREMSYPADVQRIDHVMNDIDGSGSRGDGYRHEGGGPACVMSEEAREERRRIWWLLFTIDRHLSFCYNKPLYLFDAECMDLLQPVPESEWQAGDRYMGPSQSNLTRARGPWYECKDHSILGFFMPLMTMHGESLELKRMKEHPTLGFAFRSEHDWDRHTAPIRQHLALYAASLHQFQATHIPANFSPDSAIADPGQQALTEANVHSIVVLAYSTYIMHVGHILLSGKWDPVSLLDDEDQWINSDSFLATANHAVDAADALATILEFDPDLSFMPWFFGINLLHGSFLLILLAEKLGHEAGKRVEVALERCIRAVEACVVTLSTEYQRNFRQVMHSALAHVRGRVPHDPEEQKLRRRKVLGLYRWTGDGTGLVI